MEVHRTVGAIREGGSLDGRDVQDRRIEFLIQERTQGDQRNDGQGDEPDDRRNRGAYGKLKAERTCHSGSSR